MTTKSRITMRELTTVSIPDGVHTVELKRVFQPEGKDMLVLTFKSEHGTFDVIQSKNTRETNKAILAALDFFGVNDLEELESGEFEIETETRKDFINIKSFILE